MRGPASGDGAIRSDSSQYRRVAAANPFSRSRGDVRARTGTIPVCGAFAACMKTDCAFAQALGRGVVAGLVGAIIYFTAIAASAEGLLKFAGSQLEPVKWGRARGLDG